MLIPGKSHSRVESRNSRVSIETLHFARVCTFTCVIGVGSPAGARGGRCTIGRRRGRDRRVKQRAAAGSLTRLWTVIFLVSYIEADWSGRICTAGPTQWRRPNYGYQRPSAETSVPYHTSLSFVSRCPSVRLVCGPRPRWSKPRSTDSKRGATGDNYPLTIGLLLGVASLDSRKSRNSFPGIEKKDRDSRLSSLINIPNYYWQHISSTILEYCKTQKSTNLQTDATQ